MTDQQQIEKAAQIICREMYGLKTERYRKTAQALADAGMLRVSQDRIEAMLDMDPNDTDTRIVNGAIEPGSMQEYEPTCPEHGELRRRCEKAEEALQRVRNLADEWESRNPSTWARSGTQRAIQASRECHAEELRAILDDKGDPQ